MLLRLLDFLKIRLSASEIIQISVNTLDLI